MVHPKNPTPTWVNPNDVGRKFLKRKSSIATSRKRTETAYKSPVKAVNASKSPMKAVLMSPVRASPRKVNPFKVPTPKKRRLGSVSPKKSPRKAAVPSPGKIIDSPKSRGRILNFRVNKPSQGPSVDFSALAAEFSLKPTNESSAKKLLDFSRLSTSSSDETRPSEPTSQKKTFTEIPKDLRPGIRMRLSSFEPFPCTKKLKGASTATALDIPIDDAIACQDAVKGVDLEFDSLTCLNNLSPMARLDAIGQYYVYPPLDDQLSSFPRLDAQSRLGEAGKKGKNVFSLQLEPSKGLATKWPQVFHTLFNKWYRGNLNSFYLFAHNTTILFTKYSNLNGDDGTSFIPGQKQPRVILTPTTSGIRNILREQFIDFKLPLSGKNQRKNAKLNDSFGDNTLTHAPEVSEKKNTSASLMNPTNFKTPEKNFLAKTTDNVQESPTVNEDGMDFDEWFKERGLSPGTTCGIRRHASFADFSLHNEMSNLGAPDSSPVTVETSEAARSTAVISDERSINSLFNFLCISKDFRDTTGRLAGLPPTLVATDTFRDSSSVCLNKLTQTIKKPGKPLEYIIEFSGGPILPHMPAMLMSFIQSVPSLNVKNNKMKIAVIGREPYLGFNEAVDRDAYVNHSTFVYDPVESTYEI